jgi:hypothetical protein
MNRVTETKVKADKSSRMHTVPIGIRQFNAMAHSFVTFLACPKKGDPKKGTRRKSYTACLVVLGTF